jgi:hypothetical protein
MNVQISTKFFVYGLIASLGISLVVASYGHYALAQTSQGQTAASANVTAADFNAVTNNLIIARQGILNNDSISAYGALNAAGSDLFSLKQDAAGGNETLIKQLDRELGSIQRNIDLTRDALRDINSTQALRSLNTADLRLLNVTQGLPPGEVEDAEAEIED